MKQILTIISLYLSLMLFGQKNLFRQTFVFEGSIQSNNERALKVNMNILVLLDSTIVGSYFYKPSYGTLQLIGKLKADNSFTLTERNNKDSITGYFNGILSTDKKILSGKWTSPLQNQQYSFLLNRIEGKSYWDYIKKNRSLYEYSDLQLAIKEADKVFSIDVGDKRINKLPKQLGNLKKIVSINLMGNNFTSFPVILSNLTTLEEISLSTNQLKSVSKEIGNLKNLRILIMNNNQLSELPKQIGELTNLLYLDLGNNNFKRLPEEIKYLTGLQELHIERNKLNDKEKQRIKKLLPNCIIHF